MPVPAVPDRYPRPIQARATVRGVAILQLLANGVGAVVVVIYLQLLFPKELAPGSQQLDLNILVLGLYLLIALGVALPINWIFLNQAVSWIREGREPTGRERRETIAQPFRQTFSAFIGWMGAAIVFGAVNDDVARVSAGIALAGLVVCAFLYQLLERHFRPLYALALQGQELPGFRREILVRIMVAWWLGSAAPLLAIAAAPIAGGQASADLSGRFSLIILMCVFAGGFIMRAAAGSVSRPINEVRGAMARVEDGDLEVSLPVTNVGEIGRLQLGFNRMVQGLQERRRLQEIFGRQVGTDVARQALEAEPQLGGEERHITALFVDLEGFTTFTETHSAAEVVSRLNEFFAVVIRVVAREGGWVNKFEGDAALCIFGAPALQPDHAARALRAAAALPVEVAELDHAPAVGVGLATGHVVAGNVGTTERYEYTVVGDAVNVASRLTELARGRAPRALASEETIRAAADAATGWRAAGTVQVKGRSKPIRIFEPAEA